MSRIYVIDNIEYPSVTTILDTMNKGEGITNWAVKCALDYVRDNRKMGFSLEELLANAAYNWRVTLQDAAHIGTTVHELIEEHIATGLVPDVERRPEVASAFRAFLDWEKTHGVTWIKSELKVVSHTWGYAGTLDAICLYEGRKLVLDFKTSGGFWETYRMQIAAYRSAAEEGGEITDGTAILRLDKKTGQPEFKEYTDRYERDREAFLKLTEFYYLSKDRRLKNNPHLLTKEKPCKTIIIK